MKDKIEKWYAQGLWTADMVRSAVKKGVLTEGEAGEILSGGETARESVGFLILKLQIKERDA